MLSRVGKVAYRLELPPEASIHNVFHISHWKKSLNVHQTLQSNPPQFTENFKWNVERLDVLGVHWNTDSNVEKRHIHWQHHSTFEATWEGALDMK